MASLAFGFWENTRRSFWSCILAVKGRGVEICEKHMYHPETETQEYPASELTSRRLLSSISRTLRRHLND